jgi:hypothetical protein
MFKEAKILWPAWPTYLFVDHTTGPAVLPNSRGPDPRDRRSLSALQGSTNLENRRPLSAKGAERITRRKAPRWHHSRLRHVAASGSAPLQSFRAPGHVRVTMWGSRCGRAVEPGAEGQFRLYAGESACHLCLCSVPAKGTNPGMASGSAARFLSGGQTLPQANRGHVSGRSVSSELWYELRCSRTYFTVKSNFISISMSRLSRTLCPCLEFQLKTLYAYT